jgi:hypothetical protein
VYVEIDFGLCRDNGEDCAGGIIGPNTINYGKSGVVAPPLAFLSAPSSRFHTSQGYGFVWVMEFSRPSSDYIIYRVDMLSSLSISLFYISVNALFVGANTIYEVRLLSSSHRRVDVVSPPLSLSPSLSLPIDRLIRVTHHILLFAPCFHLPRTLACRRRKSTPT